MSKLDYVTVAIVAICILAIVFFVSKMTDLFGDKPATDQIETVNTPVETEDDIYDGSTETEEIDDAENDGDAETDQADAPSSSEDLEEGKEFDAGSSSAEDDIEKVETPSASYGSTGRYMVLAGNFKVKANAKKYAAELRSMGYEHAKVELFDRGKYAVVLVDRFGSMSSAERLVNSLKKDGVSSYVKTKK